MHRDSNHRRSPRVPCDTEARVDGPRAILEGTCRDLSLGGIFFLGATLPVGTSVDLSWRIPNRRLVQAHGEVLYHRANPNVRGMGIGFRRLAQDDLQVIQQFIASKG